MTGPRWTDDAAKDVGPNTKRIRHTMKELSVVGVASPAWGPVFEDRDREAAAHTRWHVCWELFATWESWKLEALQVEGVAKGVLADAGAASTCDATVECPAMTEAARCAPVVLDGQLGDEALEAGEARNEGAVDPCGSPVADLVTPISNQGRSVAVGTTWALRDAFHRVELIRVWRPTGEEAEEADVLAPRRRRQEDGAKEEGPEGTPYERATLHFFTMPTSRRPGVAKVPSRGF